MVEMLMKGVGIGLCAVGAGMVLVLSLPVFALVFRFIGAILTLGERRQMRGG